ncbi:hypothetical protein FQA39_LY06344 [Lamprigera yunnana]|nr:hypothetical protein FQA39_LY06344 [Lamprigera yunnana]
MQVFLVSAALVAITLASPLDQRSVSTILTGVLTDLEPIVKCLQDAAQSGVTSTAGILINLINSLKSLGDVLKCPPSTSTDALVVLHGLVTCVAQNSVGSFATALTTIVGRLPGILIIVTTATGCGVTGVSTAIQNVIKNILSLIADIG